MQDQLKEKSILFDERTKALFYSQNKNNKGELIEMTFGWHISRNKDQKYFFKEEGGGYHSEIRIYPRCTGSPDLKILPKECLNITVK